MTLREEGKIDDRRFAVLRDEETGETRKFACLECQKETRPDAESFAEHECKPVAARKVSPPRTPPADSTSSQDGEG